MPRLPGKVPRRHRQRMPATQSAAASPATSGAQACHQSQRSAISAPCQANATSMSPSTTPATQNKGHACHAKRASMSLSATPSTRNEGGCHQVPRLPCKVPRRHRRPAAPRHLAVRRRVKRELLRRSLRAASNQSGSEKLRRSPSRYAAISGSQEGRYSQSQLHLGGPRAHAGAWRCGTASWGSGSECRLWHPRGFRKA